MPSDPRQRFIGLNLIKRFEGFRSRVYNDVAGIPTIGFCHKLLKGESFPNGITEDQATDLLRQDTATAQAGVNELVNAPLTQNQFDALCSFVYNLGADALRRSTLLRLLNQKRYDFAADQFLAWDHAGGVEVEGLRRRRQAERELFLKQESPRSNGGSCCLR